MASHQMALMIPLTAILAPMAIALVYVVLNAISKTICHWRDVSLKIRLAEQGLSSDEIERIVMVGRNGGKKSCGPGSMAAAGGWDSTASMPGKPPIKRTPVKSF